VYAAYSSGFMELVANGFCELGLVGPLVGILFSLGRVSLAAALAIAWSIPLSIAIYRHRRLEGVIIPLFQIIASFPATVLMPLIAVAIMEVGLPLELGALAMILLGTQWYMFFFIFRGVMGTPSEMEEVCGALGFSGFQRFRHLYLYSMLPSMLMGCIVTFGGGWNTLVVAERMAIDGFIWEVENPGIGKILSTATSSGDLAALIAATVWMSAFIVLLNRLLWRRLYEWSFALCSF